MSEIFGNDLQLVIRQRGWFIKLCRIFVQRLIFDGGQKKHKKCADSKNVLLFDTTFFYY